MKKPNERSKHLRDGDRRWQSLVSRAKQAPVETLPPMPAAFAEKLLAELPRPTVLDRARGTERLVAVVAGLTMAASLLVALLSWHDIEAMLAVGPASLEQIVQLEPRP